MPTVKFCLDVTMDVRSLALTPSGWSRPRIWQVGRWVGRRDEVFVHSLDMPHLQRCPVLINELHLREGISMLQKWEIVIVIVTSSYKTA